jgi:hypothetical protein
MNSNYTIPESFCTFDDPITGAVMHGLLGNSEPSVSLYFTQPTWTADGRHFIFLRKSADRAINYWCVDPDGRERQLTHFPVTPDMPKYAQWMHRKKLAEECERFSFLWPAIHPTLPVIVFPLHGEVFELNVATGACEKLFAFERKVCEQGFFAVYQQFTSDGKHLIFSTAAHGSAIDAPYLPNNTALKDETTWEGRLWRYDYENHRMEGEIFTSNGEQAHLLTCPWDPEVLFWANYKHACLYAMHRDGTGLRSWFIDDPQAHAGHYNWDPANRSVTTLISNPDDNWSTTVARISMDSGAVQHFNSVRLTGGQWHPTASPDGKWIVMDRGPVDFGGNGLCLLDPATDTVQALCRIDSSWGLTDEQGGPVKSEWLHPNPVWSPDGRYVVFHSDFGTKTARTWAVEPLTIRNQK